VTENTTEQDSEPGPFVATSEILAYAQENDTTWRAACWHFTKMGRDIGSNNPTFPPLGYTPPKEVVTAAYLADQAEINRLSEMANSIPGRAPHNLPHFPMAAASVREHGETWR
jgi:hypothetical protein